jgi:hypothetical protein
MALQVEIDEPAGTGLLHASPKRITAGEPGLLKQRNWPVVLIGVQSNLVVSS